MKKTKMQLKKGSKARRPDTDPEPEPTADPKPKRK